MKQHWMTPLCRRAAAVLALGCLLGASAEAQERGGPLRRLFGKKKVQQQAQPAPPPQADLVADVPVRPTGVDLYPTILAPERRMSETDAYVEQVIDQIYSEYEAKAARMRSADVQLQSVQGLPEVQRDFTSTWSEGVRSRFWSSGSQVRQDLVQVYSKALEHSNAVKVFSDLPLIRETAIREAEGDFDWRPFAEAQFEHKDEPTTSTLTTGETGQDARLIEDLGQGEFGVRKKLRGGGEMSLSKRLNTLKSNSTFLTPNPQTGSELVLGFVQPLGKGSGYAYNRARMKVAKLEANLASAEYLRSLESHLIEVNRAYWEVYLARAAYLQKRALVKETKELVEQLEAREGVDEEATRSELLRARSSLSQIEASLIRGETAIRIAEDRLRSLVNDPEFELGTGGEFIPLTRPVLSRPESSVRETALAALYNRPEVVQGFYQLRAAGIRLQVQRNEMKPELNLRTELKWAGLDEGRSVGDPLSDSFNHGTGVSVGLSYEGSVERNTALARLQRQEYEFRQQKNQLRGTIDKVLLESVVAYRELLTAYRDMQGRYEAVLSSREEVRELKERLEVDADARGQTVGYQLQLILDALERNQAAEERFLVSMVSYNSAFAAVERAKGTLLGYYDVNIRRFREEIWERQKLTLRKYTLAQDELKAEIGGGSPDVAVSVDEEDGDWRRHRKALEEFKKDRGL